jgi:hypothetical protein
LAANARLENSRPAMRAYLLNMVNILEVEIEEVFWLTDGFNLTDEHVLSTKYQGKPCVISGIWSILEKYMNNT